MAKISTYAIDPTPQLSDKALGTSITGPPDNNTANFTLQSILGLFLPEIINNVYDNEIHVSQVDGNDTTGTGSLLNPFATITKGLTLVAGQRKTIIIHPGAYTESPNVTVQFTVLVAAGTSGVIGGNVLISGTITTNTGCTISGLKATNITINGVSGTGNVNILNCDISGTLTKSGNADYTLIRFCDIGALNLISSAGLIAVFGGNPSFITVNNAGARVLVRNAVAISPVLIAGNLTFADSIIIATTSTANAFTTSAGTIATLASTQILIPSFQNVARVSLSGFYSIFNTVFDKPNSLLIASSGTGGTTNSIDYFQFINADNLVLGSTTDYGNSTLLQVTGNSLTNGAIYRKQNTPFSASSGSTVTGANLINGIIINTGLGWNLPTAANIDLSFFPTLSATANPPLASFDWSIINTNTSTATLSVSGSTGHTFVGNLTIAASSSANYRTVKTGIATYVTYIIS